MLITMCVILAVVVVLLSYLLWSKCQDLETYQQLLESESLRANRYIDHYWRLVNSPVVDRDKWEIRLPWTPVGEEDCIRLKNNNKA